MGLSRNGRYHIDEIDAFPKNSSSMIGNLLLRISSGSLSGTNNGRNSNKRYSRGQENSSYPCELIPLKPRRVGNEIAIIACEGGWEAQRHVEDLVGVTRVIPGYTGGDGNDDCNDDDDEGSFSNNTDDTASTTTTSASSRSSWHCKRFSQMSTHHETSPTYENMQGNYKALFIEYHPKMITYSKIISEVCCFETSATARARQEFAPDDVAINTYENPHSFRQRIHSRRTMAILFPNTPSQQREAMKYLFRVQGIMQLRKSQLTASETATAAAECNPHAQKQVKQMNPSSSIDCTCVAQRLDDNEILFCPACNLLDNPSDKNESKTAQTVASQQKQAATKLSAMAIEIREAVTYFYKAEDRFCFTGRLSTATNS